MTAVDAKFCSSCQTFKEFGNFNRSLAMADGLQSKCRECTKAYQRQYSKTYAYKEAKKRYTTSEKGREACLRDYIKGKSLGKTKARYKVSHAVRKGRIPPATNFKCSMCDEQAHHYHHHLGYATENHLNIIPLCVTCHRKADGFS